MTKSRGAERWRDRWGLFVLAGWLGITVLGASESVGALTPAAHFRVFAPLKQNFEALVDSSFVFEKGPSPAFSVAFGSYAHVFENLRTGLFLRHEQQSPYVWGTVQTAGSSSWRARGQEQLLLLDLTPRWQWGERLVAEVRTRPGYSLSSGLWSLRIRPGLTFAWDPAASRSALFFVQAEAYLNSYQGPLRWSETGFYLGAMKPVTSVFQPGLYLAFRDFSSPQNLRPGVGDSWILGSFVNFYVAP